MSKRMLAMKKTVRSQFASGLDSRNQAPALYLGYSSSATGGLKVRTF